MYAEDMNVKISLSLYVYGKCIPYVTIENFTTLVYLIS